MKKITATFYLSSPTATTSTIICKLFHDGSRKVFSTQIRVATELWHKGEKRPFDSINPGERKAIQKFKTGVSTELSIISTRLEEIKTRVKKASNKIATTKEIPDLEDVKLDILKNILDRDVKLRGSFLFILDYSKHFVEEIADGKILIEKSRDRYSPNSIKGYRAFCKWWEKFEKWNEGKRIRFTQIDRNLEDTLESFTYDNDWSGNYLGARIKQLKTIAGVAFDRGHHSNENFKKLKIVKRDSDKFTLEPHEVELLEKVELNSYQDRVRDLFLIGCVTGLRVSDFNDLRSEHIKQQDGQTYIERSARKTHKTVYIPIPKAKTYLFDKYKTSTGYEFPKFEPQYINREMKKIGEIAGLTDLVEIKIHRRGRYGYIKKPKFELLACHVARRTGATTMYLNGKPLEAIQRILGHSKPSQTEEYIGDKAKAKRLLDWEKVQKLRVV